MKNHSTFVKLFVDVFIVVAVVIILTGAFIHWQLNAKYQRESQAAQDHLAHIVVEHFREMWPLTPARVDEVCKRLLRDPAARLTVVDPSGVVLGDSDADPLKMANHKTPDRPEVIAALDGRPDTRTRQSETLKVQYRYEALPLLDDANRVVAAVRLAVPVRAIAEGETYTRNAVLWSTAAGAAVAVLLCLLTSWVWYAPIRRITRTARLIASGDLSAAGAAASGGRLAELAAAFDEMRDTLGEQLARIATRHEDFRAVLDNLDEGVIGTDADERIIVINRQAAEILGVEAAAATGKQLAQVVPSLDILEFDEHAQAAGTPLRKQFELDTPHGRRKLDVRATKLPPGVSGIKGLLVLNDVTG